MPNLLKFATFAENKLRLANRKSPFALACIILAENKLRSAIESLLFLFAPRLHYFEKISYARQVKDCLIFYVL